MLRLYTGITTERQRQRLFGTLPAVSSSGRFPKGLSFVSWPAVALTQVRYWPMPPPRYLLWDFPSRHLGVPWPALGASMVVSTIIEAVALMVMGTARVPACLVISLYMNFFAHVFLVGWVLWPDYHLVGGGVILLSFLIFILPIFIVDRPV